MENWITQALEESEKKLKIVSKQIGANYVNQCNDGKTWLYSERPNNWITGYWPGIMWILYDMTKDEQYKTIANEIENNMDIIVREYIPLHHDIGFMYMLNSKANLNKYGNEMSKKRLLFMANALAGRFNIKGNFIRAWESYKENPKKVEGWAIIDCTMNIPLLFWASNETGDPRFKHIAQAHADTVLKFFCRKDGSVNHICAFDPESGKFLGVNSGQGYAQDSAWARGQSWAIHGLALVFGYTKEEKYLNAAKAAAKFFVSHLPEDNVCYWDITAPITLDMPRDSSAAANAASGMLEIAKFCKGEEKEFYINWTKKILKSLYENYYIHDVNKQPLLEKATVHFPAGAGINCSVVYADYYFLEALRKLQGRDEIYLWENEQ